MKKYLKNMNNLGTCEVLTDGNGKVTSAKIWGGIWGGTWDATTETRLLPQVGEDFPTWRKQNPGFRKVEVNQADLD